MRINSDRAPRRCEISIATADGAGDIAALEFGPATSPLDILFLHANGFNAMTYCQILASLGDHMRVMAIDMRGHGRTRLPTREAGFSWQVYANDVLALMAAIGQTPRILAGHSMGATTAILALGHMHSHTLPRLVLAEPVLPPRALYGPDPVWETPMARAALRRRDEFTDREEAFATYNGRGAFKTWPSETLRLYLQDGLAQTASGPMALSCAPRWEATNFAHFGIADPYPMLDKPATPIHIIRGETDTTCSFEPPPGGAITMEIVAGTTHFLPMERPDVVINALEQAGVV